MLDRKFIVENVELVKANCVNRNIKVDVDRLVELERQRREKDALVQELNRRANEVSKTIGKAPPDQREAIRFYIREGLLPDPERPARNVAYYDPSCVERILLIKELQQKRYLPLSVIKAIVAAPTEKLRLFSDAFKLKE